MTEQLIEVEGLLIFDSWLETGPGLRAASDEDRHLIYEGSGVILDLILKRAQNGACLHVGGQVLPGDRARETVSDLKVSMEHGKERSHTHTNALGEFSFHAVANGTFDLLISLKNRRFRIRGLSNHEPRTWKVLPSFAGGD